MSGSFRIGEYDVDIIKKVEEKREEYPLCDEEGKEVKKEMTTGNTIYKNSEGVIITKTYRLINGKPFDKFKKTSKVLKYTDVDSTEVQDLIQECLYLCSCDELRKKLREESKARKFLYTAGNGYKAYISYLIPFQDKLLMYCGFGSITKQIGKIGETTQKVVEVSKVQNATPEEMLLANMV